MREREQTERGASQLVAAQMLHASREREGSCVDCRRGGVLQAAAAASRARARTARGVRPHAGLEYIHTITVTHLRQTQLHLHDTRLHIYTKHGYILTSNTIIHIHQTQ